MVVWVPRGHCRWIYSDDEALDLGLGLGLLLIKFRFRVTVIGLGGKLAKVLKSFRDSSSDRNVFVILYDRLRMLGI